jgi:hypothetical protein
VPSESWQKTITGGKLELLPPSPLLETPASKWEELLAGQNATTVPPKAKQASAEISAQPAA